MFTSGDANSEMLSRLRSCHKILLVCNSRVWEQIRTDIKLVSGNKRNLHLKIVKRLTVDIPADKQVGKITLNDFEDNSKGTFRKLEW